MVSGGYDRQTGVLEIKINTGKMYQHFGVPLEIARGLVRAKSPGRSLKRRSAAGFGSRGSGWIDGLSTA